MVAGPACYAAFAALAKTKAKVSPPPAERYSDYLARIAKVAKKKPKGGKKGC